MRAQAGLGREHQPDLSSPARVIAQVWPKQGEGRPGRVWRWPTTTPSPSRIPPALASAGSSHAQPPRSWTSEWSGGQL